MQVTGSSCFDTHACACIAFLTVASVSYHFLKKGTDAIYSE